MKRTGVKSNANRGLDRSMRKFLWTAARIGRRDSRLALFYAKAAAREAASRGIQVAPIAAVDSQHLNEIVDGARRTTGSLVLPVVQEWMLDSSVLAGMEGCPNVIPLLHLDALEDVADGLCGQSDHIELGDRIASITVALRARRVLFGGALDVTRSTFPIWTSRAIVRPLIEAGFRTILYVEHTSDCSCARAERMTAAQLAAMPLTLDLLGAEFPALFLSCSAQKGGMAFLADRELQHRAADSPEEKLVA